MFDIGWSELLLIGVVALIVIGPKELPGVLRTLGQWMTKVRRMANEFQNQFQDAIREAELAELKKEVDEMAAKASSYTQYNPLDDVRRDLEKAADLPADPLAEPALSPSPAVPPPSVAAGAPVAPPAAEPITPAATDDVKPDAGRAA